MKTINIKEEHAALLERSARRISLALNKRVPPKKVLETILDLVMEDEAMYDPETGEPLTGIKRKFVQQERERRTVSFDVEALIDRLRVI